MFQIAALVVQIPALEDSPSRDEDKRYRESLVNIHEHAGSILASSILTGIASALAAGVLYYLYRAACHRRPQLPAAMGWIFLLIPMLRDRRADPHAAQRPGPADRFFESGPARTNAAPRRWSTTTRAPPALALNTAACSASRSGTCSSAMQAMRVGLLSRFLGVLAVVAGALMILPLVGLPIVQIFWLGAVGVVLLGRWPGGRGPAWESGEAEPWPRPPAGGLLGGAGPGRGARARGAGGTVRSRSPSRAHAAQLAQAQAQAALTPQAIAGASGSRSSAASMSASENSGSSSLPAR